ncbi:MAG TPA: pitrilysin family protein, partial [Isosphaeraceae bacterium]|nr:pitrilysin family protein [Isosphaeraceae bacterium]
DPWGRPSPGTRAGLEAATPKDLRSFWRQAYRPNGAILGVAGAIDWPQLKDAIGRLFGSWEHRPEPRVSLGTSGPKRDHIPKESQQLQIALAYPTAIIGSPEYYHARAAAAILGGYSSARLFTEVREKRGLCYSVYASYEGQRDRAAVLCYAGTAPERAQQTLDVTLAEIARLASAGIDAEELDTMRASLKSSLIMQQESSMSRSSSLASDWFHLGRVRSLAEISTALDALTPASVGAYAATIPIDDLTILTLGPSPLVLPAADPGGG